MKYRILSILLSIQPIFLFCFQPISTIKPNKSKATLINSVSFHPSANLFCVTFTHHHQVGLYEIMDDSNVRMVQMLQNPHAKLYHPQNAVFSPDGNHLVIVNWSTGNFNIYAANSHGRFQPYPQCIIPCNLSQDGYRPHGMCFSPDGSYLSVIYGSFKNSPWAIVLYHVHDLGSSQTKLELCSSIRKGENLQGVPKGVTFSPDGSSLLVTFTVTDSIAVFSLDLEKGQINPIPEQEIAGAETQLCRPEDITLFPDGSYCAVSNSSQNTVSLYHFDKLSNRFTSSIPFNILRESDTTLFFPHGLGFSSDGKYFAITQFGLVDVDDNGFLNSWGTQRVERVSLFRVDD